MVVVVVVLEKEKQLAGQGKGRAGEWEGRSSKGSMSSKGSRRSCCGERGAMEVVQPLRLTPTTPGNRQNRRYCTHH